MGKYATGDKPDNTNNLFLMQDLDITIPHEISELVWAATYDERLHARVMRRVTEAANVFVEATCNFDGVSGDAIEYNWLPVRFYMAITRGGQIDEYDGFKITVSCEKIKHVVDVFFAKNGTYGQEGVWGRSELGGWSNRIPTSQLQR